MSQGAVPLTSNNIRYPPEPTRSVAERWVERRISLIWALLLFNTLAHIGGDTVVTIPPRVAQLFTMGALACAFVLALSLNRALLIRRNVVLSLFTVLAVIALMTGVRGMAGLGGVLRPFRFLTFLATLWLLTPWWGRRDLLLAKCHLKALVGVLATVLVGLVIAPSAAFSVDGRLSGALWPLWPTAVAHFAAVGAGMAVVLWLSGSMDHRRALVLGVGGIAMVLLSQTRIAMLGLGVGLLCAALTLFVVRRRVRRTLTLVLALAPLAAVALAPALSTWVTRGQTAEEIAALSGRKNVWTQLLSAPRSGFEEWFGFGLGDKSFNGLSIDSSWLAVYQEQGRIGVLIVVAILLFLLVAPAFVRSNPSRALAVFLIVYCVVDSYTEVGLGDASPYLLDLTLAASMLVPSGAA